LKELFIILFIIYLFFLAALLLKLVRIHTLEVGCVVNFDMTITDQWLSCHAQTSTSDGHMSATNSTQVGQGGAILFVYITW